MRFCFSQGPGITRTFAKPYKVRRRLHVKFCFVMDLLRNITLA